MPWEAGELRAVGGGTDVAVHTAGPPTQLRLSPGPSRVEASDAYHVEVRLHDAEGHRVRHLEAEVAFTLEGQARLLGVDNGSARSVQPYASDRLITSQGRALAVVEPLGGRGGLSVRVSGESLMQASLDLASEA